MAKCPQCGQDLSIFTRHLFTGACRKCGAGGYPQATLGCGSLILIALIVSIFTVRGRSGVEREMGDLRSEVGELKTAVQIQTGEIKALRRAVEDSRRKGPERDK